MFYANTSVNILKNLTDAIASNFSNSDEKTSLTLTLRTFALPLVTFVLKKLHPLQHLNSQQR